MANLASLLYHCCDRALVDRSERNESGLLYSLQVGPRLGRFQDGNVDCILATPLCGKRGIAQYVIGLRRSERNAGLDRKLIHRQGAGLVAAKNVDAGE